MRSRYLIVLTVVALVIVLPAIVARICGASIYILAFIASFQYLAVYAFFLTVPVSLWLTFRALLNKDWKRAAAYAISLCVPLVTAFVFALVNGSGLEAAMGI